MKKKDNPPLITVALRRTTFYIALFSCMSPSYADPPTISVGTSAVPAAPATGVQPYTLEKCLSAALHNPHSTARSGLLVDQARRHFTIVHQELRPSFVLSGRAIVNTNPAASQFVAPLTGNVASSDAIVSAERARGSIGVNYILWDAGKRSFQVQAAKAGIASALASQHADQQTILQTTSVAFYTLLHADRALDAGRQQVQAAKDNLKDAQTRYSVGTVTRSDVLTAKSALSNANSELKGRQIERDTANAVLSRLVGTPPSQPLTLVATTSPDWAEGTSDADLLDKAQRANPQRLVLEAQRTQDMKQLAAIRAGSKPVLSVNGEAGWIGFRDINPPNAYAYQPYAAVSATVSAPLFDKTRQQAEEEEALDAIKLQDAALDQLTDDLREGLAIATATYANAEDQIAIAKETVDNAAEAYQFALDRYAIGKSTEDSVVQGLAMLAVARDKYEEAQSNRDTAAQNLRWIAGLDSVDNSK